MQEYANEAKYKKHMRKHTGRFVCPNVSCKKEFSDNWKLKTHQETHLPKWKR